MQVIQNWILINTKELEREKQILNMKLTELTVYSHSAKSRCQLQFS